MVTTAVICQHPVDPQVRVQIEATLRQIERGHDVRILYACESGSRGWGFASPDSDYDVRFLYVHKLDWYLAVTPGRDVIELPISDVYDVNGWDLRKALGLLRKGNATLVEWLSSPIVYAEDSAFMAAMRAALDQVYSPERAFHHYLHMAKGNFREYLRGDSVRLKKYLHVLRPLLACLWVEQGRGPVPMRFQDLVDALVMEPAARASVDELLTIKRQASEREYGAPFPAINAFLDHHLARLDRSAAPPTGNPLDCSVLDRLLHDTVLITGHKRS